jgi:hypothetical protein
MQVEDKAPTEMLAQVYENAAPYYTGEVVKENVRAQKIH